jgi:SnoaL-like domain
MRFLALLHIVTVAVVAVVAPSPAVGMSCGAFGRDGVAVLPVPVQRYFDAVAAEDLDRLVQAFAPRAVVIDVGRRVVGRRAIRRWAAAEVIGGKLELIRIESRSALRGTTVLVRFTRPGAADGFRAHYRFVVRQAGIVLAELAYA